MVTRPRPPKAPLEETAGHPLITTAMDILEDRKLIATGGKDGSIWIRNLVDLTDIIE